MGRVKFGIIVVQCIICVLVAMQGGFIVALRFVAEYQDSDYLMIGLMVVGLALAISIVPMLGLLTGSRASRSRILTLPVAIVVVPALIGVVGAFLTD